MYAGSSTKFADGGLGRDQIPYAPGTQRRNFTHVDDIVRGLILVGEFSSGDEYGLGADTSYSVLDIASLFGDETRSCPKAKHLGW